MIIYRDKAKWTREQLKERYRSPKKDFPSHVGIFHFVTRDGKEGYAQFWPDSGAISECWVVEIES